MTTHKKILATRWQERFRGLMPVVVDVETTGVDPYKNALLEISIVLIDMNESGIFSPGLSYFEHVLPFEGAILDAKSLEFNQIDPFQPLRFAIDEKEALQNLFIPIDQALKMSQCQRAVLVGHNAWFDLLFIKEAAARTKIKMPFHSFTCFDTATLAGFMYGQTVLAKAVKAAGFSFDPNEAHSAIYDATMTAELFCEMLNTWRGKVVNT